MKKSINLMIGLMLISSISTAQIKVWESSKSKPIKTKGAYLELESVNKAEMIPAFTVVGTILPYAMKWGGKAIANATERKEEDYKSEYGALNEIKYTNDGVKASQSFMGKIQCIMKGESTPTDVEVFKFDIKRKKNELAIGFDKAGSSFNYALVKSKKKFDMILTQIKISINADVKVKNAKDDFSYNTSISIGTGEYHYINYAFRNGGEGQMLVDDISFSLPSNNSDGHAITYQNFTIGMEITQTNPFGMTDSKLNKFLSDNSESIQELFGKLLIKD